MAALMAVDVFMPERSGRGDYNGALLMRIDHDLTAKEVIGAISRGHNGTAFGESPVDVYLRYAEWRDIPRYLISMANRAKA
ncbi:hypothetical protein KCP69_09400 [Salmonella enterica subsp. enterica]|nr:hypothetical protein KCP69_09400 [Salmonella enterica subsp. enterica]